MPHIRRPKPSSLCKLGQLTKSALATLGKGWKERDLMERETLPSLEQPPCITSKV